MTFAAGWTPCIGPLLGAILSLALNGQDFWFAIAMLLVYSLGLAIPFLLSALLLTGASGILKQINRHAHTIEIVSAVFLVTIGLLLITNRFEAIFNSFFSRLAPAWLLQWL
jgi:cytochrome c-type biogenesis protein